MRAVITVAAGHIRMLIQFGARRGLDVPAFVKWLGIDPAVLEDVDARVPHERFAVALDEVSRLIQAPDLGLELAYDAVEMPQAHLAFLNYVAQSSATIGAAYDTVIRYLRIVHDGRGIWLDAGGPDARIYIQPPLPLPLPRHAHDFMLASMYLRGRRLAAESWSPHVVRFAYARPADVSMHRRIFGASLEFGCERSELVFDRAVLDRPVLTADPMLHALMQQHAEQLIARLPRLDSPADRVRQAVAMLMSRGVPELEAVARHLHTSARTLQRTLNHEGLTFRQLVDAVRRDLGVRYVADDRLPLPEVAFLLGFSDTSSFHRAFRRWTGSAPGEYRRAQRRSDAREPHEAQEHTATV
ncbi:MAG TPA: AraC family transcriptional regulator [Thermoanaerobaculia bacterium]|nr:AraC family transcriptional regulator [Thermoanaerobaculia bacterium]